jgi:hypothetical protein
VTRERARVWSRWVFVGALLALAAVVRVSAMFYGTLSGDDATVALVAKHFLAGEDFPAFFYRQTYMGSLNGIHLVPALYASGPSVLLVRLNAIAWSLLFPLGLYLLARRIFDEPTGRVTLALAAVPPFLLTYWSTVAEPHFETNVFGVFILLLALTALTARSEPARTRALAVLGLLSGLAAWTNVKVVAILGPVLLLLVLRRPAGLVGRGGALLVGGFLLGTLPAWLFYAVHGDHDTPGSVGPVLRFGTALSPTRLRELWTEVVLGMLGTYYWPVDTRGRWAALAVNCTIYALAVGFALAQLGHERRTRPDSARAWGLGLLLLTLAASLGAVYLSGHAGSLWYETTRYALPAYIPLLVCAGALVARASRRSRAIGAGLLAFLLLFAAWTNLRFLWPLSPAMRARESAARAAGRAVLEHLETRPVDALYVEDTMGAIVWAFLLGRPTVSAMISDVYVPHALAADAAERIDVLAPTQGSAVAADLAAVGATWRLTPISGWKLFEEVRVPPRAYRALPRDGWRVAGDPSVPASVADGDLATAWPLPGDTGPLSPLVVDLGQRRALARVVFWPSLPTPHVFSLRVTGSEDGRRWEPLGVVPAIARQPTFVASGRPVFRPRNGWLELAVASRPVRYLRVEPAEPAGTDAWGVVELQVYEAADEPPPVPVKVDALVERLRAGDVGRLLADPVVSARVARATRGSVSTLPANGVVDNHGAAPPQWLARPIRLRARDGLLVPIEDWPDLQARLYAAGTRYAAEPLGSHALVRVLGPLAATAECRPAARRAVTREPAGDGSESRVTVDAALRDETLVSGARLWLAPGRNSGLPRVEAAVSQDGQAWQPAASVRAVPEWGWAGRTLFAAPDRLVEVVLDPVRARHLRMKITARGGEPRLMCVRGTPAAGP